MTKIGFIGLGHMGAPMVRNLLKHQHDVYIYDAVPAAMMALTDAGAIPAQSLKTVAQHAEVFITMLPSGENVAEICTGASGLFKLAQPGSLFIDSSSIAVDKARELHQLAARAGIQMLDAPVSGGTGGAEAGTLTFMVGGGEAHFNRAKPILECMGKKIVHMGAAGNGQATKISNNLILGISMIAVAEGMTLGKKLGIDPKKLFEICSNASAQCWSLNNNCPVPDILPNVPSSHDYQAGFTSAMMLKDLKLSQLAAQTVSAVTPLGAEATALYTLLNNLGHGSLDFSAIIKLIEAK